MKPDEIIPEGTKLLCIIPVPGILTLGKIYKSISYSDSFEDIQVIKDDGTPSPGFLKQRFIKI